MYQARVLELVRAQFVGQPDAAPLVPSQVDHDTTPLVDDPFEGLLQLRPAVAAPTAEHVTGEALRADPGQHRLVAGQVPAHQRHVLGVVDRVPVPEGGEVSDARGQPGPGDSFDEPLHPGPVRGQVSIEIIVNP